MADEIRALRAYWLRLAGSRPMPSRLEIDHSVLFELGIESRCFALELPSLELRWVPVALSDWIGTRGQGRTLLDALGDGRGLIRDWAVHYRLRGQPAIATAAGVLGTPLAIGLFPLSLGDRPGCRAIGVVEGIIPKAGSRPSVLSLAIDPPRRPPSRPALRVIEGGKSARSALSSRRP